MRAVRVRSLLAAAVAAVAGAATLAGCPAAPARGGAPTTCGLPGPDRDGDGLPDALEDLDGDGMQDFGECDPNSPDSDRDGLVDSIEVGCDGVWLVGLETRCDVRDTDGDGLDDGVEDRDQDGRYEPNLGETNPAAADTDFDGCSDGAEGSFTNPNLPDTDGDALPDGTENPNCDRVVTDALCETDPTNPDTDGDGQPDALILCPAQLCSIYPLSRPGVTFAVSAAGGWKLALPAGPAADPTVWQEAAIAGAGGPGDVRAAGVADVRLVLPSGAPAGVLAFVAAVPLGSGGAGDVAAARAWALGALYSVWPSTGEVASPRARGTLGESWDGAPLARGLLVALAPDAAAPRDGATLRRAALAALLGVPAGAVTDGLDGADVGVAGAPVVLTAAVTVRADRLLVTGALADAALYDDDASGVRPIADDLAGGAALAAPGDGQTEWCGSAWPPRDALSDAAVDLLLVVDPAAVPSDLDAAVLGAHAALARTLLRTGVTDMSAADAGALCPLGADAFLGDADAATLDACLAAPWSGGTPDPAAHHGVETAHDAVLAHLPRLPASPARLGSAAELAIVWLAAAPPQGLYDQYGPAPSAAEVAAYVAPEALLYAGLAPAALFPPGAVPADATATLAAALSGTDPAGVPGWLPAYADLADSAGGAAGPPSAALVLDALDRAAARAAPLALPPAAIPASASCNIAYLEVPHAREGGFTVDPATGGVLFHVGNAPWPDRGCYARLWVDRTP